MAVRGADAYVSVQFHANSWALAFGAPMFGAKLVLPGEYHAAGLFLLADTEPLSVIMFMLPNVPINPDLYLKQD